MVEQIFVNLPVKDLSLAMDFFKGLGFSFNADFTDENAACLVLGEHIYAMLLMEDFFKTFTPKKIAHDATEVLLAIQLPDRAAVDELIDKGVALGGKEVREKQDQGWMYARSLMDLDGHIWEVMFMNPMKKG